MTAPTLPLAANLVPPQPLGGHFYLQQAGWLALLGLLFYWLENATTLDVRLARLFFDAGTLHFPLQNSHLLEVLNHRLLKYLLIAGAGVLALQAVRRRDARLGVTLLAMLLATAAVSWLKAHSAHSCPWDVREFGGHAEAFLLFDRAPLNAGPGRCFPGGHASGGFAVMALFFYYRPGAHRRANRALVAGLVLGMLMGLGQMARGAHFLSHNLWSGWVVWLVATLVFALYDYRLRQQHKRLSVRTVPVLST